MIDHGSTTRIAADLSLTPGIGHVQAPPAATTAQQAGEQRRAMTWSAATHPSLHLRILLALGLERFVLGPRDIARMMVGEEDRPVGRLTARRALTGSPPTDAGLRLRAPEDVDADIDRIGRLEQRPPLIRRRGGGKAGAVAARSVGSQRELRDQQ